MDNSKSPVTRGALERVLARAAELQAATGDAPESEAMTEAQLIELGKEVGLSPEHLRQALAEERARGEPTAVSGGFAFLGPSRLDAQRVVPGRPDTVIAALDRWMQNEEWMRVVRQRADRMVWEPRNDLLGGLRRAFGSRPYMLHATAEVSASVVSVDNDRSLVALSADLTSKQREVAIGATTAVAFGAAGSGVLVVLGFMTAIAVAPALVVVAGSVWVAREAVARARQRTQVGLEQVLDRLERRSTEQRPPSLLQMIDSALPRLR